jgi:transcriptional regulator with XRE-family HTH domain
MNTDETVNLLHSQWFKAMEASESFAELLKAFRHCEGWTQQEAAQKLGITKQALSAYERSIRKPSLKQAMRFGEIFGYGDWFALRLLQDEAKEAGLTVTIQLAG